MDRFYVEMSILTVKHIYNYNIGLFIYKYVYKMTPDVFDNFFRNISDIHQHNTRNDTETILYNISWHHKRTKNFQLLWSLYLEFYYQKH